MELKPSGKYEETWKYFGCPDCGDVFLLPYDDEDQFPWCVHASNYSWRAPHPETQKKKHTRWTQMILVRVFAAD